MGADIQGGDAGAPSFEAAPFAGAVLLRFDMTPRSVSCRVAVCLSSAVCSKVNRRAGRAKRAEPRILDISFADCLLAWKCRLGRADQKSQTSSFVCVLCVGSRLLGFWLVLTMEAQFAAVGMTSPATLEGSAARQQGSHAVIFLLPMRGPDRLGCSDVITS